MVRRFWGLGLLACLGLAAVVFPLFGKAYVNHGSAAAEVAFSLRGQRRREGSWPASRAGFWRAGISFRRKAIWTDGAVYEIVVDGRSERWLIREEGRPAKMVSD